MDKGVIVPMMVQEKRKPKLFAVGSYLHPYFDVFPSDHVKRQKFAKAQ